MTRIMPHPQSRCPCSTSVENVTERTRFVRKTLFGVGNAATGSCTKRGLVDSLFLMRANSADEFATPIT
uniref:DNA-directed RNA polymerases and III subunit rpabc4 n=1 Tax=Pseudodiaptomus poplesia TaxID=213370 RepID=A0A1S6GLE3_9MAXI|nr:DNA-directed RNA polymerases and III subunit rpabc4 [Pseudodiaptomus poplesia]